MKMMIIIKISLVVLLTSIQGFSDSSAPSIESTMPPEFLQCLNQIRGVQKGPGPGQSNERVYQCIVEAVARNSTQAQKLTKEMCFFTVNTLVLKYDFSNKHESRPIIAYCETNISEN